MENSSCSEDSYDSIYKCSCLKMLCPKHYFSHHENFPNHQIDRIKMNVNEESRKILINLVIACKLKIMTVYDETDSEFLARNLKEYQSGLAYFNTLMHKLNLLLIFLVKTEYVLKKTFYTPFEYFLHQPTEKASNFAHDFKFPEDIDNLFKFNYFKFEDKRYIFGFTYQQECDNFDLSYLCKKTISRFFLYCEYEMGYEALQNYINIREIDNQEAASFWLQFAKITYDFIIKRKTAKLIKQWKKIEANLPKDHDFEFYRLSEDLFEGLNEKGLVLYLLRKIEIIMKDYDYKAHNLFLLGLSFWGNRNYIKAKKYFIKCIREFRNSSDIEELDFVIRSCSVLLKICKNQRKIVNIVNKIVESLSKSGALDKALLFAFDNTLLIFHIICSSWDNAHKIAWKLIKLYEQNQRIYPIYSKSEIYFSLAFIYRELGYIKKALQALSNAKSCCGIIPVNHSELYWIFMFLGVCYFQNEQYKDAAYYFEYIINYTKYKIYLTPPKFYASFCYFYMRERYYLRQIISTAY